MSEKKNITVYRQQLRDRIIDTAMRAFAAQGVRAVKMDDIAQSLGISKRTLYELYENKEELLFEGIEVFRQRREADMAQVVEHSANVMEVILYAYRKQVEESKQMCAEFFSDMVRYPRVMASLEENNRRNHDHFIEFLHRGVSEGFFRDDVDYEIVTVLFDAIAHQIMARQLYRQYTVEQLFHNLVFTSLRGFCTQRGVEELDRNLKKEQPQKIV